MNREKELLKALKELRTDKNPTDDNLIKQILVLLELSTPKKEVKKEVDYTSYLSSRLNNIENERINKGYGYKRKSLVKRRIK